MATAAIPIVDLSPFFTAGNEAGQKRVKELITEACSKYGFFQLVNHGVPLDLMKQAMELSKTFFRYPDNVKQEYSSVPGAPLPTGYLKKPSHSPDKSESLLMFSPGSPFNILPSSPPDFSCHILSASVGLVYSKVLEEMFKYFTKLGQVLEGIINDCLGLPENFLKQYNGDGSWDFMLTYRYFPATEEDNNGISEHEDANLITFVIQEEDVGGLEVRKDGEWIPVISSNGAIIINISDTIQVLSNKKFKSATHRVVRPKGRYRHSFVFFRNVQGDKWVEPLPEFTEVIGEKPKYRGFYYKDYQALRYRNKSHPPSRPEDVIHITHYEI